MSTHMDCSACMRGDHANHDGRHHGIPGLLGGHHCACTGDCKDRWASHFKWMQEFLYMPKHAWVPPEVELDEDGKQVLSLTESGNRFSHYEECSDGCGYLIGMGDAIESCSHRSCWTKAQARKARGTYTPRHAL